MQTPSRATWPSRLAAVFCWLVVGCLDADQDSLVVKPQRSDSQSAATDRSNSSRQSSRDADLDAELAQVDELIRTAGGNDESVSRKTKARDEADSLLQLALAEEPAAAQPKKNAAHAGKANRLAKESSPYLLLHAHNPVDWFPWGTEAFNKAKKENKLIFLSIGYTSCHWCHVMERLVFSNAAIAKFMNENFVCVKVDREERPDIDDIYMTSLSVYFRLSGSEQGGGWPLSMFLTPDGKPIAGGTYFPPEDSEGRMGFPSVMKKIGELWRDESQALIANADVITQNVRRIMSAKVALQDVPLTAELAGSAVKALADSHDAKFGGFDFNPLRPNGPKFPVPTKLALLLYQSRRDNDDALLKKITFTLDAMAAGGIRDHLAGGFHRYSTDRAWRVPHFEKMLYDNAQLVDVYAEAFRQTKSPAYRAIAEEICDFILRDMTDKQGGFFSALDADSEDVEGKSYVWSEKEIDQLLSREEAEAVKVAYGLREPNTFEVGFVLHQPKPLSDAAATLKLSAKELDQRLATARAKLLKARNRRPQPLCDDKILTGWNGLMIRALANASARLNRPEYLAASERAAMFVLTQLRDDAGRLRRTYRGGMSPIKAYLDDYANLVDGLLALHVASREQKWLNAAAKLTDEQLKLFADEQNGGFYFTATDHEELLARAKDRYDSVVPSGNSTTVRNLIRLAKLTGNNAYRDQAERTLKAFAPHMQDSTHGFANMALGLFEFLDQSEPGTSRRKQELHVIPVSNEVEIIDVAAQQKREPAKSTAEDKPVASDPKSDAKSDKDKKNEILTAEAHLNVDRLPAGSTCRIAMVLDIGEGWHINQNPPDPDFMTPTRFTMKTKLGTKLTDVKYPKGQKFLSAAFGEPVMVYEGRVVISGTLEIPEDAGGKTEEFELQLKYQACSEARCELPKTLKLVGKVAIAPAGEKVKTINDKLFNPPKPAKKTGVPQNPPSR